MSKILGLITALLLIISAASAAPLGDDIRSGFAMANPSYMVEQFVEGLEVELAGIIGGEELKSKALANNAEESLSKAEKLKSMNRTDQADKFLKNYQQKMNRSKKIAGKSGNRNLSQQLEDISKTNTERLNQVKSKAPEQAQKGLEKAIHRSNRAEPYKNQKFSNKTGGKPDNRSNIERNIRKNQNISDITVKNSSDKIKKNSDKIKDRNTDQNTSVEDSSDVLNETEISNETETSTSNPITGDSTSKEKNKVEDRKSVEDPQIDRGLN